MGPRNCKFKENIVVIWGVFLRDYYEIFSDYGILYDTVMSLI